MSRMQNAEAQRLRDLWGDKHCSHLNIEKEYDKGGATGDWCCTQCGHCEWGSNWSRATVFVIVV